MWRRSTARSERSPSGPGGAIAVGEAAPGGVASGERKIASIGMTSPGLNATAVCTTRDSSRKLPGQG
jgi:hypothetical protein